MKVVGGQGWCGVKVAGVARAARLARAVKVAKEARMTGVAGMARAARVMMTRVARVSKVARAKTDGTLTNLGGLQSCTFTQKQVTGLDLRKQFWGPAGS